MPVLVYAAFRLPFALRGILLFVTIMKRHAITSGDVLRIEADAIEAAEDGLSVLSRVPTSLLPALDLRSLHKPQGPRSGVSAVIGRWPGDETDDEVDALLTELS